MVLFIERPCSSTGMEDLCSMNIERPCSMHRAFTCPRAPGRDAHDPIAPMKLVSRAAYPHRLLGHRSCSAEGVCEYYRRGRSLRSFLQVPLHFWTMLACFQWHRFIMRIHTDCEVLETLHPFLSVRPMPTILQLCKARPSTHSLRALLEQHDNR